MVVSGVSHLTFVVRDLDRTTLDRAAPEDRLDPGDVQVEALEEQEREEQPALPLREPALEAGARLGQVLGVEDEDARADVGVGTDLVRLGVVARVLALPPAVAHPGVQVGDHQAGPLVPPAGREDLPVRGVVAQEHHLTEQDRQDDGGDELPPRGAEPHERHHRQRQQGRQHGEPGPVVAVPAAHQTRLLHHPVQGGEVADVLLPRTRSLDGHERSFACRWPGSWGWARPRDYAQEGNAGCGRSS